MPEKQGRKAEPRRAWIGVKGQLSENSDSKSLFYKDCSKLQALVYNILHPTTATVNYAIGLKTTVSSVQFFRWCANASKFVTDNSIYK